MLSAQFEQEVKEDSMDLGGRKRIKSSALVEKGNLGDDMSSIRKDDQS
jgi:hypothetical protein